MIAKWLKDHYDRAIESSALMDRGQRVRTTYAPLDVGGEDFDQIGAAFETACCAQKIALGNGTLILMDQRQLVDFAVARIEKERKIP